MSITIQPPQPGDLITSSFMRLLIDQLIALDKRVTALEGVIPGANGNLAIISLSATDLNIGDELRIFGVNFGLPAENTVTFSGLNPIRPAQGDDNVLILKVPPLTFAGDSHVFDVAVSNARGFDKRPLTVHVPQQTVPTGTLQVGSPVFPAGNIDVPTSGFKDYTFQFTIEARTSLDETYNMTPTFPQGWNAVMVTDMTGASVLPQLTGGPNPPPWQIFIPKPTSDSAASKANVFVRLSIPSNAVVASGGTVGLNVSSVRNPNFLSAPPFTATFALNAAAPNPQTLSFGIQQIAGSDATSSNDTVYKVPTRTNQPLDKVTFAVHGLSAVQYQVDLSWKDNNSNGWQASFGGTPGPNPPNNPWPIMQTTVNGPGDVPVTVSLTGAQGAKDATLIMTVQKTPVTVPVTKSTDYGILNQVIKPA